MFFAAGFVPRLSVNEKQVMPLSEVTEMLLYAASRAQLMKEVIGPAIEGGKVVCMV